MWHTQAEISTGHLCIVSTPTKWQTMYLFLRFIIGCTTLKVVILSDFDHPNVTKTNKTKLVKLDQLKYMKKWLKYMKLNIHQRCNHQPWGSRGPLPLRISCRVPGFSSSATRSSARSLWAADLQPSPEIETETVRVLKVLTSIFPLSIYLPIY